MKRLIATVLVLLIAILITSVKSTYACTSEPHEPPPIEDRVAQSEIVFEGIVVQEQWVSLWQQVARVRVLRYFKGGENQPELVMVDGFGDSASCSDEVFAGNIEVFYVDSTGSGEFHAEYYDLWAATDSADANTIAQIIAAIDQEPITPVPDTRAENTPTPEPHPKEQIVQVPTPTLAQASAAPSNRFSLVLFLILLVLLLCGVAAWLFISDRRSSQLD